MGRRGKKSTAAVGQISIKADSELNAQQKVTAYMEADGYKRSAYFYKEKLHADGTGGKLVAGPVWDYNLAYGNCNFCNASNLEAWCFEGGSTQPTPAMWQRLLQDPAFRKAVKIRYQALRKGVLSNEAINGYIDRHVKQISPYTKRHFEKYPELLVSKEKHSPDVQQPFGAPNMGGFPGIGVIPGEPPLKRVVPLTWAFLPTWAVSSPGWVVSIKVMPSAGLQPIA